MPDYINSTASAICRSHDSSTAMRLTGVCVWFDGCDGRRQRGLWRDGDACMTHLPPGEDGGRSARCRRAHGEARQRYDVRLGVQQACQWEIVLAFTCQCTRSRTMCPHSACSPMTALILFRVWALAESRPEKNTVFRLCLQQNPISCKISSAAAYRGHALP